MKNHVRYEKRVDYRQLCEILLAQGEYTITRKGDGLRCVRNFTLELGPECVPICDGRDASETYLQKEFAFYLSGSNKLSDALECSKFWKNCSDDGMTVNSNYGKLLLYDTNAHNTTQFAHAYNCLINNQDTKKAVMCVYSAEHAYISNDNPCTMFVQFYISDHKLNMHVVMRSNDIFYGLPYDLPWYRAVQLAMLRCLRSKDAYKDLALGRYEHQVLNLHMYDRNASIIEQKAQSVTTQADIERMQEFLLEQSRRIAEKALPGYAFMQAAWDASTKSACLKKQCGAALVLHGQVIATGYGDRHNAHCSTCARDTGEKFYSDGCYSVHAEMRAIVSAMRAGYTQLSDAVMYVTHGPCDACCKLMHYVGIRRVIYDIEYKTKYQAHWPELIVTKFGQRSMIEKFSWNYKPIEL